MQNEYWHHIYSKNPYTNIWDEISSVQAKDYEDACLKYVEKSEKDGEYMGDEEVLEIGVRKGNGGKIIAYEVECTLHRRFSVDKTSGDIK